jgi:hypothetical protein
MALYPFLALFASNMKPDLLRSSQRGLPRTAPTQGTLMTTLEQLPARNQPCFENLTKSSSRSQNPTLPGKQAQFSPAARAELVNKPALQVEQ